MARAPAAVTGQALAQWSLPSSAVRFLPGHDQWVMGVGTGDVRVVPPDRRAAVTRKSDLVTVGGVVRGTWATTGQDIVVTWLDQDAPPRRDLAEESDRVARILDRPLPLVLQTG